jgi:hypothetical protein
MSASKINHKNQRWFTVLLFLTLASVMHLIVKFVPHVVFHVVYDSVVLSSNTVIVKDV